MTVQVRFPSPVVGHRGAARVAPENTLASLRTAAAGGALMVEVDATLTADGQVVLLHDDDLDRTTTGTGPVAEITFDAIRRLDAGSWFGPQFAGEPVPTLEAAIALLTELGIGLNLEIKPSPGRDAETAEAVLNVTQACWPGDKAPPIISSFSRTAMAVARDVASSWPRALLEEGLSDDWQEVAETLDVGALHLWHEPLRQDQVQAIRQAGYAVAVYTVNDAERARTMWSWGVDAVITDDPAALLREARDA